MAIEDDILRPLDESELDELQKRWVGWMVCPVGVEPGGMLAIEDVGRDTIIVRGHFYGPQGIAMHIDAAENLGVAMIRTARTLRMASTEEKKHGRTV